MFTIRMSGDHIAARKAAESHAGSRVHIVAVFFVSGEPSLRDWVWSRSMSR